MSERVNLGKSAPALYQAVMGVEKLSAPLLPQTARLALHVCCVFVHPNSTSAHSLSGCILGMPWPVASQAIA